MTELKPFARVDTVKPGDILVTDSDFTCCRPGEEKEVFAFEPQKGLVGLYIKCDDGKHFLDGQIEGDWYIGLWMKGDEPGG